ncbi:hypothetical protein CSUI_007301, partial [Cystoisospora suis]
MVSSCSYHYYQHRSPLKQSSFSFSYR